MNKLTFLDNFINVLYIKIEDKAQLISFISKTLNIERDPASRRLNKKVNFTIEEVGILALKLEISLDNLLRFPNDFFRSPQYQLHSPKTVPTMDIFTSWLGSSLNMIGNVCLEPTEYGNIFTYPSMEFLVHYKNLLKAAYYKWGYYHVDSLSDFKYYSTWEVPEELLNLNRMMIDVFKKVRKAIFIWDASTIWSYVNDINYFISIGSIDYNDAKIIKNELHQMLSDIEDLTSGRNNHLSGPKRLEIYISNTNIGASYFYFKSHKEGYNSFRTDYIHTLYNNDYQTTNRTCEWIHSMKRICTLISESGDRERRIFFENQHKIVDTIPIVL